ncbi:MAG: M20/M25/M40 family metallo-hydrolase, partial [Paracoccaceae bacterium]
PAAIHDSFVRFVESRLPPDCTAEFPMGKGSEASQMSVANPAFEGARQALSTEWGRAAAYVGCGGSIPIAGHFQKILGMDSMLIGFGRDDDQIHSPNEKYDLESFQKGIRSWVRILGALSGKA